jgi:hypothetical protein
MYCKIIRDYFTRIEEAPIFLGKGNRRTSAAESEIRQIVSARFTILEPDEENDDQDKLE